MMGEDNEESLFSQLQYRRPIRTWGFSERARLSDSSGMEQVKYPPEALEPYSEYFS